MFRIASALSLCLVALGAPHVLAQAAPPAPTPTQQQAATTPAPGSPGESCLAPGRQVPTDKVAAVLVNPKSLLSQYPLGGGGLSGDVRALVATAPEMLDSILSIIPGANQQQKSAIGAGLASAALACIEKRPDVAGQIQSRILALSDQDLLVAFAAASGGPQTAAVSLGPIAVGGGGGPGPALGSGFAIGAYGGGSFSGVENRGSNLFANTDSSGSSYGYTTRRVTGVGGSVSPTAPSTSAP